MALSGRRPPVGLREEPTRGIAYMVAAVALFSVMAVLVKAMGAHYPVGQVMFFRNAASLPPALAIMVGTGGIGSFRTRRPMAHVLRAVLGVGAMGAGFSALSMMPLVDATALSFTQPLFLTLLAIPILGERVGLHRGGAVLAGFLGVVVLSVGQGGFGAAIGLAGLAAALANAFFSALTALLVRQLSATESSATITAWQSSLMTLLTSLLLPFGWIVPTPLDFVLLAGIGLCGGVAQYWMTQAYRFGAASMVSAFNYSGIVWATLYGALIWNEVPGPSVLAGALIVIGAGLYILQRELVLARARRAAKSP
ncbi:MAG: DMT family transporter [Acetobacteraceae bacterium]|nr:DMT family transporter [Acetobacteraceae bacterium]